MFRLRKFVETYVYEYTSGLHKQKTEPIYFAHRSANMGRRLSLSQINAQSLPPPPPCADPVPSTRAGRNGRPPAWWPSGAVTRDFRRPGVAYQLEGDDPFTNDDITFDPCPFFWSAYVNGVFTQGYRRSQMRCVPQWWRTRRFW